jgi:hypothetical protein
MNMPKRLGRKACRKCFTKISEATWDYLFDTENKNGLVSCRLRTKGTRLVYYDLEKLQEFLCMKGYYTPDEFTIQPQTNIYSGLVVRQHRMIG